MLPWESTRSSNPFPFSIGHNNRNGFKPCSCRLSQISFSWVCTAVLPIISASNMTYTFFLSPLILSIIGSTDLQVLTPDMYTAMFPFFAICSALKRPSVIQRAAVSLPFFGKITPPGAPEGAPALHPCADAAKADENQTYLDSPSFTVSLRIWIPCTFPCCTVPTGTPSAGLPADGRKHT